MMASIDTEQHGIIDSSRIETAVSNVFEVFSAPGEIVLAFGAVKPAGAGRNDVVPASLANRIILSPHLAKRFTILLAGKVLEYESVFGPLTGEGVTCPEEEKSTPGFDMPQYASEQAAEKAAALIKLIETLDVDFCLERSLKISDRSLLTGRFIVGFNKAALHGNQDETACSAFVQMGMPERFMDECRKLLPATEFIHFGFEEQADGCCLYKAYLEFRIQNKSGPHAERGTREPYLLFLGFKWDPFDTRRSAMSR